MSLADAGSIEEYGIELTIILGGLVDVISGVELLRFVLFGADFARFRNGLHWL